MMLLLVLAAATAAPRIVLPRPAVRALLRDSVVTGGASRAAGSARLSWSAPVRLVVEPGTDETIVRFDRPLTDAAIAAFRRDAGEGLGALEWNDTSLVLRAAVGHAMAVRVDGDALAVTIVADAAATPAAVDDGAVAYGLAAVASDSAAGYPGRARKRLAALDRRYPGNPRIARAIADADVARGAARRAAERYRALDAQDDAARGALRNAGGEASIGGVHREGADFAQTEVAARFARPVTRDAVASAAVRFVRTRADTVVVPGGVVANARNRSVLVDGSASVAFGETVRVDLLASGELTDTRVGVGGRFYFGPGERELRMLFAYHLPDLATAEEALLGGYVDRIGAGGSYRLSADATIQLDVAANGYGLRREGRRATSVSLTGGLDYVVRRGEPSVSLLYRLDAEYVDRLDRRGSGFATLPLVDRENHTVQALAAKGVGPVRLAAAAGWTFDRFGSDGPTATASANGAFGKGWRAEAAGGVTSISRPDLSGTQVFARASLARSLGRP